MTFVLYTLWFIFIAVVVNVVMEKIWQRIPQKHDERGEISFAKHRR